jgi:peptidoglycan/xylan/chitin deacetylase (PgdA/CDA1 family)
MLAAILAVGLAVMSVAPTAAAAAHRPVYHGSRDGHVVALTFDDGWSVSATARIFEILQRRGVPATFFPYAMAVTRAPSLWREIAAAGYPIGGHTKNHPDLTQLPAWRVKAELDTARTIVEGITGRAMVRVFRPPFGARNTAVDSDAASAGFATDVLWDVDAGDASLGSDWATVFWHAIRGGNGSIVLMHAGPAVTPTALDAVISNYQARGFRFVTIPELLGETSAPWPGQTGQAPDRGGGTVPGGGALREGRSLPGGRTPASGAIPRPL